MCVFRWSTVGSTYKPLINLHSHGYNGLWHSPNALQQQQQHSDKACIYNHTPTAALYMCVCTLWHICVYTQIFMLQTYLCTMGILMFTFLYLYIYLHFSVFVCVCVWENDRPVCKWAWSVYSIFLPLKLFSLAPRSFLRISLVLAWLLTHADGDTQQKRDRLRWQLHRSQYLQLVSTWHPTERHPILWQAGRQKVVESLV